MGSKIDKNWFTLSYELRAVCVDCKGENVNTIESDSMNMRYELVCNDCKTRFVIDAKPKVVKGSLADYSNFKLESEEINGD